MNDVHICLLNGASLDMERSSWRTSFFCLLCLWLGGGVLCRQRIPGLGSRLCRAWPHPDIQRSEWPILGYGCLRGRTSPGRFGDDSGVLRRSGGSRLPARQASNSDHWHVRADDDSNRHTNHCCADREQGWAETRSAQALSKRYQRWDSASGNPRGLGSGRCRTTMSCRCFPAGLSRPAPASIRVLTHDGTAFVNLV